MIRRFKPILRFGAALILPAVSAVLYMGLALEEQYQAGWYAAQECRPEQGCSLGASSIAEMAAVGALVLASFVLVGAGRTRWGNYLAIALALLCGTAWLGATR